MRQFVESLLPTDERGRHGRAARGGRRGVAPQGLEARARPRAAVVALAELLVESGAPGGTDEALALLDRIPESAETRRVAALARMGADGVAAFDDGVEAKLDALLDRVKDDEDGPPGVRRPARAARPGRPPHGRATASSSPPACSDRAARGG